MTPWCNSVAALSRCVVQEYDIQNIAEFRTPHRQVFAKSFKVHGLLRLADIFTNQNGKFNDKHMLVDYLKGL
jgi:hypothetical protein